MSNPSSFAIIRAIVVALGLLAAGPSFAAGPSDKPSKDLVPVTIGNLQAGVSNALIAVAQAIGAFEANGLAVKVSAYPSGAAGADVSDLETGRTDFAYSSLTAAATYNSQAVAAGKPAPLVVIAAAATGAANLVLAKGVPYNGPQDLKGLTIGVARITSSYIPVLESYLREQKTSIKDLGIKFVVVTDPNMVPALTSGQIKGFIQNQPTSALAEMNGVGRVVLSLDDWGKAAKVPILGLFVTAKWLKSEKNQETARRVIKALEQANDAYVAGPKSRWVPVIVNYTGAPANVIEAGYDKLTLRLAQPFRTAMNAYFEVSIPALVEQGVISPKLTINDVADFSYAK